MTSTQTPAGAVDAAPVITRDIWLAATAIVVGLSMALLDTTIVNVALDAIGRGLGGSLGSVQWVATGYLLTLAVVIPVAGWASERFGARRLWIAALLLFVVGSALCGAAWSIGALIVFRVVQGLGGGLLTPVGMSVLARSAGPARMGRVMAVVGVPMLLVPVLGPVLGGLLVDAASWRWIFYLNLPLGVLALVLAIRLLPASGGGTDAGRMDWAGLVLLAPGLAAIVFGLSEIQSHGRSAASVVWVPLLAGVLLVALFVVHARRAARPLVDVRLFARPPFAAASTAIFFVGAALYGAMLVMPLYYQVARGQSPWIAGLLVAPQGLGAALAMRLTGRLTDRVGGGPVASAGLILLTVATVPLMFVGPDTSYWWLAVVLFVRGMGVGGSLMPITAAVFTTLTPNEIPRASSTTSVLQQLGGSLGTTVLSVILARRLVVTGAAHAFAQTFVWAIALAGVALAAAVVLALTARRARRANR